MNETKYNELRRQWDILMAEAEALRIEARDMLFESMHFKEGDDVVIRGLKAKIVGKEMINHEPTYVVQPYRSNGVPFNTGVQKVKMDFFKDIKTPHQYEYDKAQSKV